MKFQGMIFVTGSTWLIAVIITLAACPIVVLLWWAASSHHRDVRRARIAAEMTATYEAVHDPRRLRRRRLRAPRRR